MALFGNKESKGNKQSNTGNQDLTADLKATEDKSRQLVLAQAGSTKKSLGQLASKACGICEAWKKQSCQWLNSPQMKKIAEWRKEFVGDFCHPLANFYRSLPQDLTNFKNKTFGSYPLKERYLGLEGLILLVSIITFNRTKVQSGRINRLLYTIRNATVAYLVGGLFIAPEIYNPLIKSDF